MNRETLAKTHLVVVIIAAALILADVVSLYSGGPFNRPLQIAVNLAMLAFIVTTLLRLKAGG